MHEVAADKGVEDVVVDAHVDVAGLSARVEAARQLVHGDDEVGPVGGKAGAGRGQQGQGGASRDQSAMRGNGSSPVHVFLLRSCFSWFDGGAGAATPRDRKSTRLNSS